MSAVIDPAFLDHLFEDAAILAGIDLVGARSVMNLRRRFGRDGNRRRLFTALDDHFGGTPIDEAIASPASASGNTISLSRLALTNWKVFQRLQLDLPDLTLDKPVTLVGGKNGYGKTSLLEALLYGLFGRAAILDLARPEAVARGIAYRSMLERAFNRSARDAGDGVMAITTHWKTAEGPLRVERRWYFDEGGALLPDDESLTLWTGDDALLMACPDDTNPLEYFQAEIERRLLTPSMGAFVFFDGEQVKRFAEAAFTVQVRSAVESVAGLTAWRRVAADLRDYARDRGRMGERPERASVSTMTRTRIEKELAQLRSELAAARRRRLEPEADRDRLLEEIADLEHGSFENLHVVLEQRQSIVNEQVRARHDMAGIATRLLPRLLAGRALGNLGQQLEQELAPGLVESALFRNEDALEALLAKIRTEGSDVDEASIRSAWLALGASQDVTAPRHGYLPYRIRTALLERAKTVVDIEPLAAAIARQKELGEEVGRLDEVAAQQRQRDARLHEARAELATARQLLSGLDGEIRVLEERLSQGTSEMAGLEAPADPNAGASQNAQVRQATQLADAIDRLVEMVLPNFYAHVGDAMTEAYIALAHKGLVAKISVSDDGSVALLDRHGHDVRDFDGSAGESQVFAMALMASVSTLTGYRYPVVIDTPLGRLDPEHRRRILSFFTSQPRQTILLSQPDEVSGAYLAMIRERVAGGFRLEHHSDDGHPGGSVATSGYFEPLAA